MAKNYTCELRLLGDREFYVLKTKASNIKLVNLYNEYGKAMYIDDTNYYGMNASFINTENNCLLNIAYQDGKCIGSGTGKDDGYKNACGTGLIYWTGTQLKYYDMVLYGSSSLIPTKVGSWAQGGYNIYLCDRDWKSKFLKQSGAEDLLSASARTGVLINENTNYVYLFATRILSSLVDDVRNVMMEYAGISEGGSSGAWKAILTDGGRSTQMSCETVNLQTILSRKVPQIFALVNKT